jgi:AmiR/NasT family two-component response regulator
MNRKAYILAGNYLMLDDLYAEKRALEKQVAALTSQLNAHKAALARAKKLLTEYAPSDIFRT